MGGDGKGNNCNLSGLVGTFHDFGKHNKVPMLWIYSENDKWFPPEMARHFQEAFLKGGGTDEFVMTPPDGEDGHNLFSHTAKWTPTVEEHLRKLGLLPLGDKVLPPPVAENVPLPAGLNETGARAFRQFLTAGPFKAFAKRMRPWVVRLQLLSNRTATHYAEARRFLAGVDRAPLGCHASRSAGHCFAR